MARDLAAVVKWSGEPGMMVTDNGTGLTSSAILKWHAETKVEWQYVAPGKPRQNGFAESFKGQIWEKVLHEILLGILARTHDLIEAWVSDDTLVRPHFFPGYQPAAGLALQSTAAIA